MGILITMPAPAVDKNVEAGEEATIFVNSLLRQEGELFSVSHTLFSKELGKVNIHYTHRQLDLIMYNATVLSTMWWL